MAAFQLLGYSNDMISLSKWETGPKVVKVGGGVGEDGSVKQADTVAAITNDRITRSSTCSS